MIWLPWFLYTYFAGSSSPAITGAAPGGGEAGSPIGLLLVLTKAS